MGQGKFSPADLLPEEGPATAAPQRPAGTGAFQFDDLQPEPHPLAPGMSGVSSGPAALAAAAQSGTIPPEELAVIEAAPPTQAAFGGPTYRPAVVAPPVEPPPGRLGSAKTGGAATATPGTMPLLDEGLGVPQIAKGVTALATAPRVPVTTASSKTGQRYATTRSGIAEADALNAGSDLIEGAAKAATPFAIAGALVRLPPTLATLGLTWLASSATQQAAAYEGARPEIQRFLGNLAGAAVLVGGTEHIVRGLREAAGNTADAIQATARAGILAGKLNVEQVRGVAQSQASAPIGAAASRGTGFTEAITPPETGETLGEVAQRSPLADVIRAQPETPGLADVVERTTAPVPEPIPPVVETKPAVPETGGRLSGDDLLPATHVPLGKDDLGVPADGVVRVDPRHLADGTIDDKGKRVGVGGVIAAYSGDTIEKGKLRGVVTVNGQPYAVVGLASGVEEHRTAQLAPLVPADQWTGPTRGYHDPQPDGASFYEGVRVTARGRAYVMGPKSGEIDAVSNTSPPGTTFIGRPRTDEDRLSGEDLAPVDETMGREGSRYEGERLADLVPTVEEEQRGRLEAIRVGEQWLKDPANATRTAQAKKRQDAIDDLRRDYEGTWNELTDAAGETVTAEARARVEQPGPQVGDRVRLKVGSKTVEGEVRERLVAGKPTGKGIHRERERVRVRFTDAEGTSETYRDLDEVTVLEQATENRKVESPVLQPVPPHPDVPRTPADVLFSAMAAIDAATDYRDGNKSKPLGDSLKQTIRDNLSDAPRKYTVGTVFTIEQIRQRRHKGVDLVVLTVEQYDRETGKSTGKAQVYEFVVPAGFALAAATGQPTPAKPKPTASTEGTADTTPWTHAEVVAKYRNIKEPPHEYFDVKNEKGTSPFPPGMPPAFYDPFIRHFDERAQTAAAQARRLAKKPIDGSLEKGRAAAGEWEHLANRWREASRVALMRKQRALQEQPAAPVEDGGAIYFRSGVVNATADFDGLADAKVPIGVTAHGISEAIVDRTVKYVRGGGTVFVDSGAFGHADTIDFQQVLALYERLASRVSSAIGDPLPRLYVVAPDVVGDAAKTEALQAQYASRLRVLAGRGVHVIMPLQQGAPLLAQMRVAITRLAAPKTLGRPHPKLVFGIPFNKAAFTAQEVADALRELGEKRPAVHLFGIGERNQTYTDALATIRAAAPDARISSDSNRIAALFAAGRPAHADVHDKIEERAPERIDVAPESDTTELTGDFFGAYFERFSGPEFEDLARAARINPEELGAMKGDPEAVAEAVDEAGSEDAIMLALHQVALDRAKKVEAPKARRETITEHETGKAPARTKHARLDLYAKLLKAAGFTVKVHKDGTLTVRGQKYKYTLAPTKYGTFSLRASHDGHLKKPDATKLKKLVYEFNRNEENLALFDTPRGYGPKLRAELADKPTAEIQSRVDYYDSASYEQRRAAERRTEALWLQTNADLVAGVWHEELARRQADLATIGKPTHGPEADATGAPPSAADTLPPGAGPHGGSDRAERPPSDRGGPPEGGSDRDRVSSGRVRSAADGEPYPELAFVRQPQADNVARLTPPVRRELRRIVAELETFPFTEATWTDLSHEAGLQGNVAGGHMNKIPASGGAAVYTDILGEAPLPPARRRKKGEAPQLARQVSGSRAEVLADVRRVLAEDDIHNNRAEGAVRVAELRAAGKYQGLSAPWLPENWDEVPPTVAEVEEQLDELDADDADITFDPAELETQAPAVDRLETGEEQPRLPGAEPARQVGKADVTFKAPVQASGDDFSLTPEGPAKPDADQQALFDADLDAQRDDKPKYSRRRRLPQGLFARITAAVKRSWERSKSKPQNLEPLTDEQMRADIDAFYKTAPGYESEIRDAFNEVLRALEADAVRAGDQEGAAGLRLRHPEAFENPDRPRFSRRDDFSRGVEEISGLILDVFEDAIRAFEGVGIPAMQALGRGLRAAADNTIKAMNAGTRWMNDVSDRTAEMTGTERLPPMRPMLTITEMDAVDAAIRALDDTMAEVTKDPDLNAQQRAAILANLTEARGNLVAHDRPLFSRRSPAFYSALVRAGESLKQTKGTPEQMLAMVTKTPGVTKEELEWSGLAAWLQSVGPTVTKTQIVDYLRANELQVLEEVLRDQDNHEQSILMAEELAIIREHGYDINGEDPGDEPYLVYENDGHPLDDEQLDTVPDVVRQAFDRLVAQGTRSARHSAHVLPGGRNYHEVLLMLPPAEKVGRPMPDGAGGLVQARMGETFQSGHWEGYENVVAHVRFTERTANSRRMLFIEEVQSDWHQQGREEGYYNQRGVQAANAEMEAAREAYQAARPDLVGVLETVDQLGFERMNEAVIAVVNSPDWKDRYDWSGVPPEDLEAVGVAVEAHQRVLTAHAALTAAQAGHVPDAPFKTTWRELAMKRMVRWAAEHGFDEIGWTTGDQQNARYRLEHRVAAIHYSPPEGSRRGTLEARDWEGGSVAHHMIEDEKTLVRWVGKDLAARLLASPTPVVGVVKAEGVAPAPTEVVVARPDYENRERLVTFVLGDQSYSARAEAGERPEAAIRRRLQRRGSSEALPGDPYWVLTVDGQVQERPTMFSSEAEAQAAAERVRRSQPKHTITGKELVFGGTGMRGFYDKILVDYMNKFGKAFGVKVGTAQLPPMATADASVWRVYDGPRDWTAKTLEQRSRSTNNSYAAPDLRKLAKMMQAGFTFDELAQRGLVNYQVALALGGRLVPDENLVQVHAFDVTEAMVASALRGLPLFARADRLNQGLHTAPAAYQNGHLIVSTRVPHGTQVTTRTKPLLVNWAAVEQEAPEFVAKMADQVRPYPQLTRAEAKGTDAEVLEAFFGVVEKNLRFLWNKLSEADRARARQWYVGAHRIAADLARQHGITHAQASALLAVLSPQQEWFRNVSLAQRVMAGFARAERSNPIFKAALFEHYRDTALTNQDFTTKLRKTAAEQGQEAATAVLDAKIQTLEDDRRAFVGRRWRQLTPEGQAKYVRAYDEVNNEASYQVILPEGDLGDVARRADGEPNRIAWSAYPRVLAAIKVLHDGSPANLHYQLGDAHKVRSFFNNISDPWSVDGHVTIDVQAVAAALLEPLTSDDRQVMRVADGNKNIQAGLLGNYVLYVEAYRRVAAALTKETGALVLPHELQAVTWEALRGLFRPSQKGKRGTVSTITAQLWAQHQRGRLAAHVVRNSIFKAAGGLQRPAWRDQPSRLAPDEGVVRAGDVRSGRADVPARPGLGRVHPRLAARRGPRDIDGPTLTPNLEIVRPTGAPRGLLEAAQFEQQILEETYRGLPALDLSGRQRPVMFLDAGQRLTPLERARIINEPDVQTAAAALMDILDEVGAAVLGDAYAQIERTGIVLDDAVYGVYLPQPGSRGPATRATILLNPFEHLLFFDPQEAADRTFQTMVHELLHLRHPHDGPAFERRLIKALAALDPDFRQTMTARIMEAYVGRTGVDYRRGLRRVLPFYARSRRRDPRAFDALSLSGRHVARSESDQRPEGQPAGDLRPGRTRTVSTGDLDALARRLGTTVDVQRARAEAAGYTIVSDDDVVDNSVTLQSTILPGAAEFAQHIVEPVAQHIAEQVRRNNAELRALFAPASVSENAAKGSGVLRANLAARAQRMQRARRLLRATEKMMDGWSKDQSRAFWDVMEGLEQPDTLPADQRPIAALYRFILNTKRDVELRPRGLIKTYLRDYWGHEWLRGSTPVEDVIRRLFGRRPLQGPESYRKKRTIPTMRDGLAYGLEPVSWNPTTQLLRKLVEMDKSIAAYDIMQELKARGLAKFYPAEYNYPKGLARYPDSVGIVYGRPVADVQEAFDPALLEGLEKLLDDLGVEHARRVNLGGTRWGYAIADRSVVAKVAGPEGVVMHELGHILDTRYGLKKMVNEKQYRQELRDLADLRDEGSVDTRSETRTRYVRKGEEKVANLIHAYLYAPARARQVAPQSVAAIDQLVREHPELAPLKTLQSTRSLRLDSRSYEIRIPGKLIAGYYYGPHEVVRLMTNHLSPGLRGRSVLFDLYRFAGNYLNMFQLGWSGFHLIVTGMESMVSKQALAAELLLRGEVKQAAWAQLQVGPQAVVRDLVAGHGQLKAFYAHDANAKAIDDIIGQIVNAGGGFGWDLFEHAGAANHFMAAFRGAKGGAAAHDLGRFDANLFKMVAWSPLALAELPTKAIMEGWVPRLKIAAFMDLAAMELQTLGPNPDLDEVRRVLGIAWDSIDNRFGQLRYDNLFWHNALKDLGMASTRALGWHAGTLREMWGAVPAQLTQAGLTTRASAGGGGRGKPPMRYVNTGVDAEGAPVYEYQPESRIARKMIWFVAMFWIYGLWGAIYQYLKTGERPRELKDFFFPRTGAIDANGREMRVSIPGYFREFFAIISNFPQSVPRTAKNWMNPMLTAMIDLFENEDFYGTEIHDTGDPLIDKIRDDFAYAVKQYEPFSSRNIRQRDETSATSRAESLLGITPAPASLGRSALDTYLHDLMPPAHRTKAQAARGEVKREVRRDLRAGDVDAARAAAAAAGLSGQSLRATARTSRLASVQFGFQRATFEQALRGYIDFATPEERGMLRAMLARKQATGYGTVPPEERPALKARFDAAMALPYVDPTKESPK